MAQSEGEAGTKVAGGRPGLGARGEEGEPERCAFIEAIVVISTGEPLLFTGGDFVHTDVALMDLGSG